MILADTSVWVDHLRADNDMMRRLLAAGNIVVHPYVLGEIALGHLQPRGQILRMLQTLPHADIADAAEVLEFIERYRLIGAGIGYVDAHLLTSAAVSLCAIWTRDKRLHAIASRLGIAAVDLH